MTGLAWETLSQDWAEQIVNSIPAGLLIAGFAWTLLWLAGKRSSGTRFAVWFLALLAIAGLPFMGPGASSLSIASPAPAEFTLPGFYATILFVTWMAFASLALARVAFGLWRVRQFSRQSSPVAIGELSPAIRETIEEFTRNSSLTIAVSSSIRVPTLIGFRNPKVLLPAWALSELSPEELKVVLLHEFAHLSRRDAWTNLAQKIIRAVFFFHPAVWWVESRLSLEREIACDDRVLAETGDPRAYAECLVTVAEKSFAHRGLALAQAVVSRVRETALRLTQILDAKRPSTPGVWKPALGIMAGFAVASLVLISRAPQLVGFVQPDAAPPAALADVDLSALGPPALPAAWHSAPPVEPKAAKKKSAAAPTRNADTSALVAVKMKDSKPPAARLVQTRTSGDRAPQMWFVVETVQFDGNGSRVWSLRVWRLTVFTPVQKPVPPARST